MTPSLRDLAALSECTDVPRGFDRAVCLFAVALAAAGFIAGLWALVGMVAA